MSTERDPEIFKGATMIRGVRRSPLPWRRWRRPPPPRHYPSPFPLDSRFRLDMNLIMRQIYDDLDAYELEPLPSRHQVVYPS